MTKPRKFDPASNNYFIAFVATMFTIGGIVAAKIIITIIDWMR